MAWVRTRKIRDGTLRYTGYYRDPAGATRSAGSFPSHRGAERAAVKAEGQVVNGTWFDTTPGTVTFKTYAEDVWWPSLHVELTTRAGYRSNLETHFIPYFGSMPMGKILPSHVQAWVNKAIEGGLTSRSVVKYHVVLHGIFKQAVRDRIIPHNPASETRLPKVVRRQRRILTPAEFKTVVDEIPNRWLPLVLTSIETGLRWGELVALRPRHIEWLRYQIRVEETVLELAKRNSPTGQRIVFKPYPKDDEPRTLAVTKELIGVLTQRVAEYGLGPDHLLFPSTEEPA